MNIYYGIQLMISREVEPFDPCVMSVITMHAGSTVSTNADKSVLEGCLRCLKDSMMNWARERLTKLVASVAEESRATWDVSWFGEPLLGREQYRIAVHSDGVEIAFSCAEGLFRAAEDFMDGYFFGGAKVSRLMHRMASYYLLEPERVHVCTISAKQLTLPLDVTKYAHLFDIKDSGDDFYFDNVTAYVRKVIADIEKLDFDDRLKREIRVTAWLIERILPEYVEIWNYRSFEIGIARFYDHLPALKAGAAQ